MAAVAAISPSRPEPTEGLPCTSGSGSTTSLAAAADRFVAAYAAGGEWAQLFARADGFLGTELFRSAERLPPGELCVRGRGGSSR